MIRYITTLTAFLHKTLAVIVCLCLITLIFDVLWGIATRYIFPGQSTWTEELARLLLVWVGMLASAFAYGEKAHLSIDLMTMKLHKDARRIAAVSAGIACFFFAVYVMIWGGIQLTTERFHAQQVLPALQVSRGWVYLSVPIAGLLISCYCMRDLLVVISRESQLDVPKEY